MNKLNVVDLAASAIPAASTNYTFIADVHEVQSLQVVWGSTTASFSFVIQVSNDGTNYTNWDTAQPIANDSGSVIGADDTIKGFKYIRVALTKTSGTLTAFKVLVANQPR